VGGARKTKRKESGGGWGPGRPKKGGMESKEGGKEAGNQLKPGKENRRKGTHGII